MKPLKKMYTNSDYSLTAYYKDSMGTAINITGASAKLVIRKTLEKAPIIQSTGIVEGANGKITFNIPPADNRNVLVDEEKDVEKFLIGAVLTLSDGKVITLFQSTIEIQQNIVD